MTRRKRFAFALGWAAIVGLILGATHAPFWLGLVLTGFLAFVLVPWVMLNGGDGGGA